MSRQEDLEATLRLILKKAVVALGGNAGVVAAWNEARQRLTVNATYGMDHIDLDQLPPLLKEASPQTPQNLGQTDLIADL